MYEQCPPPAPSVLFFFWMTKILPFISFGFGKIHAAWISR